MSCEGQYYTPLAEKFKQSNLNDREINLINCDGTFSFKRMELFMADRRRKNPILFYLNDEELQLIDARMRSVGIKNRSAYLRKIAIDGYVIHVDYAYLKEHTRQIRMVGININQIAHHLNATGNIYRSDIEAIKKMLDEIWQLQRSILSSLR